MKFMNVVAKFGSHKEYENYRDTMMNEAEKLINERKRTERNSQTQSGNHRLAFTCHCLFIFGVD